MVLASWEWQWSSFLVRLASNIPLLAHPSMSCKINPLVMVQVIISITLPNKIPIYIYIPSDDYGLFHMELLVMVLTCFRHLKIDFTPSLV